MKSNCWLADADAAAVAAAFGRMVALLKESHQEAIYCETLGHM